MGRTVPAGNRCLIDSAKRPEHDLRLVVATGVARCWINVPSGRARSRTVDRRQREDQRHVDLFGQLGSRREDEDCASGRRERGELRMRNIDMPAIGEMDPERLERRRSQILSKLFG
jgi:hypothetical protein